MHKKLWIPVAMLGIAMSLCAQVRNAGGKPYHPIVLKIAGKYSVSADLIHAIIRAESNYNVFAISEKGAMGLMQLMPDTARAYGVGNIFDPEENIEGGTKYLKDLIQLYKRETREGKYDRVLAAYNAGQEAVKKYRGIPPYQETKNYVKRILASLNIRTRTQIYRFYDDSGRLVLTNDPNLYRIYQNR